MVVCVCVCVHLSMTSDLSQEEKPIMTFGITDYPSLGFRGGHGGGGAYCHGNQQLDRAVWLSLSSAARASGDGE